MKELIVIAFLLSGIPLWSQGRVGSIPDLSMPGEVAGVPDYLWANDSTYERYKMHTSILPQIRVPDKCRVVNSLGSGTHFFKLDACPDIAAQYDTSLFYRLAYGISVEAMYKDKLYARASVTSGWSNREGINQTHVAFLPLYNRKQYWYTDIRTRIAYTPNRTLHIAGGIDNQFFGEGARSLIQGDQVAPNPFALMRVNFWRLEYGLLYQFFHENNIPAGKRDWKFGALHYLSYNVTRNWNIGLFETVLFQTRDSTFNRGFEVEYLNPIVFFRPQEYSLGSSDNVLLAMQTSYTFKQHTLYAQLTLDEFVLKEIRARSKWWATKYGVQLGMKGKFGAMYKYRIEGNVVRPYTYAHINNGQNYGNLGRPLAHPLGSNFAELLVECQSAKTTWNWKAYGLFQLQGFDEGTVSWGGNVYKSYLNRAKEYGNTIGQGITMRTVRLGCEMSYSVPIVKGKLYIDPQIAYQWGDLASKFTPAIVIGYRSDLFQSRRRF